MLFLCDFSFLLSFTCQARVLPCEKSAKKAKIIVNARWNVNGIMGRTRKGSLFRIFYWFIPWLFPFKVFLFRMAMRRILTFASTKNMIKNVLTWAKCKYRYFYISHCLMKSNFVRTQNDNVISVVSVARVFVYLFVWKQTTRHVFSAHFGNRSQENAMFT